MRAIVLVGHGTRLSSGQEEFRLCADLVARRAGMPVHVGFIELSPPPVGEALRGAARAGAREVVAQPVTLFAAGHVKNDIPLHLEGARREFPHVRFSQGAPVGLHPLVLELLERRLAEVEAGAPPAPRAETLVILVGRGTSDPDANGDLAKLARLLWEGRELLAVEVAFAGVTRPTLEEAVGRAVRLGARRVVVLPYLLFGGVILERVGREVERLAASHPRVEFRIGRHIGADPALADILLSRAREAAAGRVRRKRILTASHELAALRLSLMNVLGVRGEAERAHELSDPGDAAREAGPLRAPARSANLADAQHLLDAAVTDLENRTARAQPGEPVQAILLAVRKVEMDLRRIREDMSRFHEDIGRAQGLIHEVHPAQG